MIHSINLYLFHIYYKVRAVSTCGRDSETQISGCYYLCLQWLTIFKRGVL